METVSPPTAIHRGPMRRGLQGSSWICNFSSDGPVRDGRFPRRQVCRDTCCLGQARFAGVTLDQADELRKPAPLLRTHRARTGAAPAPCGQRRFWQSRRCRTFLGDGSTGRGVPLLGFEIPRISPGADWGRPDVRISNAAPRPPRGMELEGIWRGTVAGAAGRLFWKTMPAGGDGSRGKT